MASSSNCPNTSHRLNRRPSRASPLRSDLARSRGNGSRPDIHAGVGQAYRQKSRNGSRSTISTNHRPAGPRIVVNDVTAVADFCVRRSRKSCLPPASNRGRSSAYSHDSWSSLHWMITSRFSSSSRSICSRAGPREVPQMADMVWRSCCLTARMNDSTASLEPDAPAVAPVSGAGALLPPDARAPDEQPLPIRAIVTIPAHTIRLRNTTSSAA